MSPTKSFTTFSPACDLQSKQLVWSLFRNQEQAFNKQQPIVASSARISSHYAQKFA